jgi:SCP-2 sterol transfer family
VGILRAARAILAPAGIHREPRLPEGRRVATKREVEAKLRELMRRLATAEQVHGALAEGLPSGKVVAVLVTDLKAEYWTVMDRGTMRGLHLGTPQHADIRMKVTSDHLIDLVEGRASMLTSFMTGKVKIDASVSDLIRLRRMA